MRPGPIPLLAALALAGAAVVWVGRPGETPPGEPIVLSFADITVVDGDTVRVRGVLGGERIRLTGFDAPEVMEPRCPHEEERGRSATAALRSMLDGAETIELTLEPDRDAYGRGLGRLAVDGRDVGERLIVEGLARPYDRGGRRGWCP